MAKGISTRGDLLVHQTADGVDLNGIWAEIQDVLELWNTEHKSVADLLSYRTVNVADPIAQSISSDSFEEATEFGVPRAIRPPSDVLKLGYQFKDFDISLGQHGSSCAPRPLNKCMPRLPGVLRPITNSSRNNSAPIVHADHRIERLAAYVLSALVGVASPRC